MSSKLTWISLLLFLLFTAYYHFLSIHLPSGAGPDEGAHRYAIDFIYKNNRLATYPEDVDQIHLTPYGTTRSFREPFGYLWGALVSRIYTRIKYQDRLSDGVELTSERLLHSHRQGMVLLGSLSVVLLFLIVHLVTNNAGSSILTAAILGLLPQFAFLASYSNNDIAAIFVILLLVFSLAAVVKFRTIPSFISLGIACGLVLLAKPTIWAPSLIVLLFAFVLIRDRPAFKKLFLIALPVALAVSSWWYVFNAYHHGITDLRNSGVRAQLEAEYQTLPDEAIRSYGDLGYSASDLLRNEQDFLKKTYKSSIGFLDWFKVSLGPVQYGSYGVILSFGMMFLLFSIIKPPGSVTLGEWRILALLLLAGITAQFCIYMGWNLVKDRQPHGRYLLPVLTFVLLSFGVFLATVIKKVRAGLGSVVVISGILIMLGVHAHALYRYVIPFYSPHSMLKTPSGLVGISLHDPALFAQVNDVKITRTGDNAIHVIATGPDPWVMIDLRRIQDFDELNHIVLDIDSKEYDWFRLYWDAGQGFHESRSNSYALPSRHRELALGFPDDAARLRLDFGEKSENSYYLYSLALGKADHAFPTLRRLLERVERTFGYLHSS